MVTVETTRDGSFVVLVNGAPFGHMRRPEGFFVDAAMVIHLLPVSSSDLRAIADIADEFCNGPVDLTNKSDFVHS